MAAVSEVPTRLTRSQARIVRLAHSWRGVHRAHQKIDARVLDENTPQVADEIVATVAA